MLLKIIKNILLKRSINNSNKEKTDKLSLFPSMASTLVSARIRLIVVLTISMFSWVSKALTSLSASFRTRIM